MSFVDSIRDPRNRTTVIAVTGAIAAGIFLASYIWTKNRPCCDQTKAGQHQVECKEPKATAAQTAGKCPFTGASTTSATGKSAVENKSHTQTTGATTQPTSRVATITLPSGKSRVERFKELNLQRFVEIKKLAIHDSNKQILDYQTLVEIQNLALEITGKDAPQLLKIAREKRRQVMDTDKVQYAKLAEQGIEDLELLFQENLEEVLRDFGVSRDTYENSMNHHSQVDITVRLHGIELYEVIVASLPSVNQPRENTQEYFTEIYKDMTKRLRGVDLIVPQSKRAAEVKNALMLDSIHSETGLEEEDIKFLRRKFDAPEIRAIDEEIATRITSA